MNTRSTDRIISQGLCSRNTFNAIQNSKRLHRLITGAAKVFGVIWDEAGRGWLETQRDWKRGNEKGISSSGRKLFFVGDDLH